MKEKKQDTVKHFAGGVTFSSSRSSEISHLPPDSLANDGLEVVSIVYEGFFSFRFEMITSDNFVGNSQVGPLNLR